MRNTQSDRNLKRRKHRLDAHNRMFREIISTRSSLLFNYVSLQDILITYIKKMFI